MTDEMDICLAGRDDPDGWGGVLHRAVGSAAGRRTSKERGRARKKTCCLSLFSHYQENTCRQSKRRWLHPRWEIRRVANTQQWPIGSDSPTTERAWCHFIKNVCLYSNIAKWTFVHLWCVCVGALLGSLNFTQKSASSPRRQRRYIEEAEMFNIEVNYQDFINDHFFCLFMLLKWSYPPPPSTPAGSTGSGLFSSSLSWPRSHSEVSADIHEHSECVFFAVLIQCLF